MMRGWSTCPCMWGGVLQYERLWEHVTVYRYHAVRLVLHQGCVTTATGSLLVTMTIQVRQPCRKGCQGNKKIKRNCGERI